MSDFLKLLKNHTKQLLTLKQKDLLALDTETTGLDLQHSCKPFFISTCTAEGDVKSWEWPVNLVTRQPKITKKSLKEVARYITSKILVFHNSKFDIRALESIGIALNFSYLPLSSYPGKTQEEVLCKSFYDTVPAAHIFESQKIRKLKSLALRHVDYLDDDEKELKDQVAFATRLCKKLDIPVTLGVSLKKNKSGKFKRETAADYWLPEAVRIYLRKQGKDIPDDLLNNCNAEYGCIDAERTILLFLKYLEWFKTEYEEGNTNPIKMYARESLLIPTFYNMQTQGITVKDHYVENTHKILIRKADRRKKEAEKIGKTVTGQDYFNIQSPKDLAKLLYTEDGFDFKPVKYTKSGFSTDKDTLEELLQHQAKKRNQKKFLRAVLVSRLNNSGVTYLNGYKSYQKSCKDPLYSVLYPSVNQNGTATTRASSSNPNSQNISKLTERILAGRIHNIPSLRGVFSPLPGKKWYALDYSQLELRIFAVASEDEKLQAAFTEGADIHSYVAQQMYGVKEPTSEQRFSAKAISFGIIYGRSEANTDAAAGFKGAYSLFLQQFPSMQVYKNKLIYQAKRIGSVTTLFGYQLDIPAGRENTTVIDYVCQGTAGDIIKNATIELVRKRLVDWEDASIIMQVHDELIIEVDVDSDANSKDWLIEVVRTMESAGTEIGVTTPVSCKAITDNWAEGTELTIPTWE